MEEDELLLWVIFPQENTYTLRRAAHSFNKSIKPQNSLSNTSIYQPSARIFIYIYIYIHLVTGGNCTIQNDINFLN